MLAWSRVRFVRFADNERAATSLSFLAECSEELGEVPKVVLADLKYLAFEGFIAIK